MNNKVFLFCALLVLVAAAAIVSANPFDGAVQAAAGQAETGAPAANGACCSLVVPAAAFMPRCDEIEYTNNGYGLITDRDGTNPGAGCGAAQYWAPVYLPQAARLKTLTLRARDNSTGDIGREVRVKLVRARFTSVAVLAQVGTGNAAAPGDTERSVSIAGTPQVADGWAYYLDLDLRRTGEGGATDLWFWEAEIEYGFDTFFPAVTE